MAKQQFDPNDAKLLALEIEKIYKRMGQSSPFKSSVHTINELKEGLLLGTKSIIFAHIFSSKN